MQYDNLDDYNWLMGEIIRHESEQAKALGELLWGKLLPKRVMDVGCGPGIYLLPFRDHGCLVTGIDGAGGAGQALNPTEFVQVDFRKPYAASPIHDLVLCIEVAEHVPGEFADNLMDIVVGSCKPLGTIFFCAAHPGQGGEGHYNEQPQDYWIHKFYDRKCMIHPFNLTIREQIEAGQEYEHCHWLRWNSFMMKKL